MTTGLVTFFRNHHFGAQLQAYATMRALTELGYPCQIVDYRPAYQKHSSDLFQWGGVRHLARNAHTALHYRAFKRRAERFDAFVDEFMSLSPKAYTSWEQLHDDPPDCDVFVAGSDQIWNPSLFEIGSFDPVFLLTFVQDAKRISYAPSMGSRAFTEEENATLREALAPYAAVSVRESAGKRLVTTATGNEPTMVLDPTLLLTREQWAELAVAPKWDTPYILCYYISDHSALDPYAQELAQRTGLPIVQLGKRRKLSYADHVVLDAGTREFLGLFQNASYVLTNSFHGTVFSIQFGKEFYTTVSPKEMEQPENSRVYSLLERLGCTSRVAGMEDADDLDTPVDYERVNARLTRQRTRCLDWLSAALEGREWNEPPIPPEERPIRKWPALASHAACTGCSACAQVCPAEAIRMEEDNEGFLRPVVTNDCILCRKCERICPATHPVETHPAPDHVRAVWHKEDAVRGYASSGGFFPALAQHVIRQGGAVFGAVYRADHHAVYHTCARTLDELIPMSGSKYVQSDLRDSFQQARILLDEGVTVLFSGVPCQIAGLHAYLGRQYDNLITCDLVCHGVPSPLVFREFVEQIRTAFHADLRSLTFRDKRKGWGKAYCTAQLRYPPERPPRGLLRLRQKERIEEWSEPFYETTFGRGYGMQLYLRQSCGQCQYAGASLRPADFTLADYWGLEDSAVPQCDRTQGVSMVMVNSARGEALFQQLSETLNCVERPLEEAVRGNPRLASPLRHSPKRTAFFATLRVQGWQTASNQFLRRPSLLYRTAAKLLTPQMKEKLRKRLG